MEEDTTLTPTPAPSIPEMLPVLPLRGGVVVFPLAVLPLVVGQPRSVKLVDDIMRGERLIAIVTQKKDDVELAGPNDVYTVGTAATIHQLFRAPDGNLRLVVQGLERIRIREFTSTEPYLVARVEPAPEEPSAGVEAEALRRAAVDLFTRLAGYVDEIPDELVAAAENLGEPLQVVYLVAASAPLGAVARQELLEMENVEAKLRRLIEVLQHEVAVRELGRKITSETRERMSRAQREYYLREQLRSIQQELGEGEEASDLNELRASIEKAHLPEEARREAERELTRLASVPAASPEHSIIRTYLEWMGSLPWDTTTGGEIDVRHAREVLDEDHYDLDKIKDRILEYLAVKKLRQDRARAAAEASDDEEGPRPTPSPEERTGREPILCFVGPPGVGKTSLAQSIARALGRKFIRVSLGGVHDEAEVRGHRRTYIGAMPGRVIQGVRRAEARDPVFILDEVDKVGADWRGDPSSALLEVLDPAQNHSFVDNYIGVAFDLSQVMFITTANTLDSIPPPLLDRMEVLQLSGYTEDEKVAIARKYLLPKQLQAHGLRSDEIALEDGALHAIVRRYTREAGVRNLDRQIATVCRKAAREIAEGKAGPLTIIEASVETYLGRPRFHEEAPERTERPGVATGLAWTPTGGDILFVEATMMTSREEQLIMTGMLGDVMRESAQAALSYVRSNAARLGVDPTLFEGKTVHLHVPAGAIPKDGPSAGITMMTALASLASGRPVRSDVCMTGEITLRGKVLPIGGLKEKVLAAHRGGLKTVILPRQNENDLDDVPADLRREMQFVFVDDAEEVLTAALVGGETGVGHDRRPARPRAAAAAAGRGRAAARGRDAR